MPTPIVMLLPEVGVSGGTQITMEVAPVVVEMAHEVITPVVLSVDPLIEVEISVCP